MNKILEIAVLIGIVVLLVSLKISFDLQGKLHRQIEVLEAEKYIWKQIAEANISQASSLAPKHAVLTVTAFTNRPQETNEDIYTATATIPVVGRTVAVSHDLITWLGGRVYIPGRGVFRVECLMNEHWTMRMDIMMGTVAEAEEWGIQEIQVVYLGI
jgi:3D (Asp-Asp-Asp) domain-containing protein